MHDLLENKIQNAPVSLLLYKDAFKRIQTFVPKGKLLRGIQVLLGYELCGGTTTEKIVEAGSAYEILAAMILVHDDIMDNDLMRRGSQSIFAQYIDIGRQEKIANPLLYGQSMGICVGDIGYFAAYEILAQSASDYETTQKLISYLSRELQILGSAQMTDIFYASSSYEPNENEILDMFRNKTGRYSIVVPLTLGAILAQAPQATINKINNLGESLGIIFQIKDDELGLYGDEKTIGKPLGSDIRENKKTLYRSLLMKKTSEEEKTTLSKIFGNKDITTKEIEFVKHLIHSYGIDAEIQKKTDSLSHEAHSIVDSIQTEAEYKSLLKEFIELNLQRKK